MNIPTKSLTSGFELPVYGMGLWQMGGGRWQSDTSRDAQEILAIQKAIELGVTHFDTAESYGAGHSEELLGEAIRGHQREKLVIATKLSGRHGRRDQLLRSFEGSLKRLGTSYVDLYLLHYYPPAGITISETMATLDKLVTEGAIRNIGVCNMTPNRFVEAQRHSANKLVCNQVHYSVQTREAELAGVIEQSQQQDVMCVAWRPLELGVLEPSGLLERVGDKYGMSPYQTAVSWLISQPNVVTLVKTSTLEHLRENLEAVTMQMEPEDVELLRARFPNQERVSNSMPLNYAGDVEP